MVDEFIYQFQSFQQYRGRLSNKSADELALLRKCDNVWNTSSVLNYLQAMVDKSGIIRELTAPGAPSLQLPVLRNRRPENTRHFSILELLESCLMCQGRYCK